MNEQQLQQQVIVLAGIAQACHLVDLLARTGTAPQDALQASLKSLFVFEPQQMEDLYQGVAGVRLGLQVLQDLLAGQNSHAHQFTLRYALGSMVLARQLNRQPDMVRIIRSRLSHASFHSEHFSVGADDVCRQVSALYQDTLSTFRFRIQVGGTAAHLRDRLIADRVRSLLFAAVRAAAWWGAEGGTRWRLLFYRRRYLATARALLARAA